MSATEMSEICGGRPPIPPKDIIDTVPHPLDNMGYWKMINGLYVCFRVQKILIFLISSNFSYRI